ncbi:uncharacterized protein B0H64DRAFT_380644 [Chaetomium fimeti]|uniref:Uncharacterized protein n=1 Tax=Chaetomium fimeti TaxID=1854472 RepID=A0AAE0LXH5_9PEZI|nr:hypothetical protein B0H64DRAFT_380644 [Chaetomium fimeti]
MFAMTTWRFKATKVAKPLRMAPPGGPKSRRLLRKPSEIKATIHPIPSLLTLHFSHTFHQHQTPFLWTTSTANMAPSEKYTFCLPPRCAFCSFRFQDEDIITVRRSGMVVSEKFRFCPRVCIADIGYMTCSKRCRHGDEKAFACHPECLELVPLKLRSAVIEATSYRYEPPRAEDERRARLLRLQWSRVLCITFQYRFPLELCDDIAQYSLRTFAVRRALESLEMPQHATSCLVSLSTRVWVRYTFVDGVRYLQSLTNEQPPDDSAAVELAYDSNSVDTMFVAEDHLGVRNLLFTSSPQKPTIEERPNVWWRTVAIPNLDSKLEGKINGAKLRSLTYLAELPTAEFTQPMYWPTPQFGKQLWCDRFKRVLNLDPIRMSAIKCNDPSVIGYSVCCTLDFVTIHAHSPKEDAEFYRRSRNTCAVWQYMPVDKGELLVEVWKRKDRRYPIVNLVFMTNKGRAAVMGPWPLKYRSGQSLLDRSGWTLLNRPRKEPSRIFYDTSDSRMGVLAFETPPPESDGQRPASLTPLSPGPESGPLEPYFYSSSDLSGVTAVTPCERRFGETSVIRGLLLHHADAHVSCVGEVRLDSLGCPLKVEGPIWLGFSTTRGAPCVTQIATSRPAETDAVDWLALPCRGQLEWWYSFRQCRVHHEGRASPATSDVFERPRRSRSESPDRLG